MFNFGVFLKKLGKEEEVLMGVFWDVDTDDIDQKWCKHERLVHMMSLICMHIDTVSVICGYILRNNAILCGHCIVPNL